MASYVKPQTTTTMTMPITIPMLTGSLNWYPWSLRMQALLEMEGLWDCVTRPQTSVPDKKMMAKARMLIFIHVEDSLFHKFRGECDTESAYEIWHHLHKRFGPEGEFQ